MCESAVPPLALAVANAILAPPKSGSEGCQLTSLQGLEKRRREGSWVRVLRCNLLYTSTPFWKCYRQLGTLTEAANSGRAVRSRFG
jgi:hypothetical protein